MKVFVYLVLDPIGLATLELCKICGAIKIFIADINEFRLRIAREHKADFTINMNN